MGSLLLFGGGPTAVANLCEKQFIGLDKAAHSFPGLTEETEIYGGKSIRFKWVSSKHPALKRVDGAATVSAKALDHNSADDLFIGFDSKSNHAYLVFRGNRLDGGFAVTPLVQPLQVKHNTDLLSSGIIFRLRGLSTETKENLERILSQKDWGISYTCVRGVCGTLQEADLAVNKQWGKGSLPLITIKHLLLDGVKEANGNPLQTEVYLLGSDSIAKHMKRAILPDAASILAVGTIYGTPSLLLYLGIRARAEQKK